MLTFTSSADDFKGDWTPEALLAALSFFLGEERDGVTFLNLQQLFLVVCVGVPLDSIGLSFFAYGLSRVLTASFCGWLVENSPLVYRNKEAVLGLMAVTTCACTLFSVFLGGGEEKTTVLFVSKAIQGSAMSLLAPTMNALAKDVVSHRSRLLLTSSDRGDCASEETRFTDQVSLNESTSHAGVVFTHVLAVAFIALLWPNIRAIFILPIFATFFALLVCLRLRRLLRIATLQKTPPLLLLSETATMSSDSSIPSCKQSPSSALLLPGSSSALSSFSENATFLKFVVILALWHSVNCTLLPLTMQIMSTSSGTASDIGSEATGSLFFISAIFCITISQLTMTFAAKACSSSSKYGRKKGFTFATAVLTLRCFLLSLLSYMLTQNGGSTTTGWLARAAMLSMSVLDGIGVGIVGCLYVLVLSDLADCRGSGARVFGIYIGVASTAIGAGSAFSSWLGEVVMVRVGFARTFGMLGAVAAAVLVSHANFMPETLNMVALSKSERKQQQYAPPPATFSSAPKGFGERSEVKAS